MTRQFVRTRVSDRSMRSARTAVAFVTFLCGLAAHGNNSADGTSDRQSLDDAWFTGPIIAASANTLPRGRFLVEPYVYDAISYARYDDDGERRDAPNTHSYGSLTYVLYGLTDDVSVGVIPRFGFNDARNGRDSSGVRLGDVSLQAQYRFAQFREGGLTPTMSLVLQHTLPTGKHDRLGTRPSDGMGGGAHSTTIALYSQHYFWTPNGRILRARANFSQTFSQNADVADVSVYGTSEGFRGRVEPGDSFALNLAAEYSVTRNWVLAFDVLYQRDARTRLRGRTPDLASGSTAQVDQVFGPSTRIAIAPAVEYNFTSRVGVIVGARWFLAGRNADASITPVAAINMVY